MSVIEVILVDKDDKPTGTMEKLEVHEKGLLHRAVTVYLFTPEGDLLLQRRAAHKYHCGGLWSNTCCGHPFPGETTQHAAERRLQEEMGIRMALTPVLKPVITFCWRTDLLSMNTGIYFSSHPAVTTVKSSGSRCLALRQPRQVAAGDGRQC